MAGTEQIFKIFVVVIPNIDNNIIITGLTKVFNILVYCPTLAISAIKPFSSCYNRFWFQIQKHLQFTINIKNMENLHSRTKYSF